MMRRIRLRNWKVDNLSIVAKLMELEEGQVDLYSGNDDRIVPVIFLAGKTVRLYDMRDVIAGA